MRFVEHQHPRPRERRFEGCQVGGRDYANPPIGSANREEETPAKFVGPLRHECWRHRHERAMIIRIVDHILPDENTSLDRLAEPDLVRKKVSLDRHAALVEICQQEKRARQAPFARIEQLIDQVLLDPRSVE